MAKQMKLIYLGGFSDAERGAFAEIVHGNILTALYDLLAGVQQSKLSLQPENEQILQQPWIRNPSSTITPECIGEIERLWNDPAIKRVWDEDLSSVGESASYFFGQLERISSPNYIPSVEDVLRVRVKTTGVGEIAFDIADVGFRMVDVGGQRSERRKWIHCFQNVNAVIFFVAINEYNMKLIEDPSVNRMQEAIALFDEIANSRWFESSAVILFLNKQDLFQEKIKKVDMKCLFDDYDGGCDYDKASQYLLNLFEGLVKDKSKGYYSHITVATDTKNIEIVFSSVRTTLLKNLLGNDCGIDMGI
eukprot:CAMPEP_0201476990 /NCGR_PEP_ID=MMETSP0151_2-20130828/2120_1 /ASSEMBLY_ACC=CAM_ASM_000257 /TAXON_ID=200890 /ORGANISM="Paramoeba atlantica, Strain 621/1 / CCAP 1560/9" /LENGTH=304 /DNA_ID=CAMNT_0047857577 /DNA_START=297 /DNA_END=1211 /DNA_ORIENTATION=+